MKKHILSSLFLTSLMLGAAHAQVSDDVVKIGVLNDRTGVYEDLSGDRGVEIVRMAIEDFGGTVLGKKIELVDAGHENKMDLASSLVRKWIDTEQVDAIVDIMGSGVALAINEIARDSNRIMIAASAATSALTGEACSPNSFQFSYDTYALAKGTGRALVQQGKKKWFFITA
ncbi:MAG: ABC transporter substrate-binding protein, partial [Novosphingobium sp.]|nr:ABC transporter substrate-binding protein [Novosphingobium sp.]